MKWFLWLISIYFLLNVLARAAALAWGDYPRSTTYTRAEDVAGILAFALVAAWALWLVLGLQ